MGMQALKSKTAGKGDVLLQLCGLKDKNDEVSEKPLLSPFLATVATSTGFSMLYRLYSSGHMSIYLLLLLLPCLGFGVCRIPTSWNKLK